MKKILYIHNGDFSNLEGNKSQVLSMCKAFSLNEVKITLLGFHNKKDKDKRFKNSKVKFDFLKSNSNYYLRSVLLFKHFFNYYKNYKLIFTRDLLIAYFISNFTKKQVLYELHEIINNKLWLFLFKQVFKKSSHMVVISKGLYEDLLKLGYDKDKIIILDDGVDLEKFDIDLSQKQARKKIDIKTEKTVISYVGNTSLNRDLLPLSKAIKGMKHIEAQIYGKRENYLETISTNQNNFKFKGYTLSPEIIYKASDILFAGYNKNLKTIHHMSPLKVFEYMASKVPIVIADFPRNRDILTDKEAFFYKSEDANDLKRAINDALLNKDKKHLKAFEKVKKYTWKKRAEEILRLYEK